jgi:hypothetical protein
MESFIDSAVPIFGIVGIFGMPVFIVWLNLHFDSKTKEQFHASLQKLIASGQELTPELLQSIPGYKEDDEKQDDIRNGTILTGVGVGVALLGKLGLHSTVVWASGLLVSSIGIAILAYGIYAKNKRLDDTV